MKTLFFVVLFIALTPITSFAASSVGSGDIQRIESSLKQVDSATSTIPCDPAQSEPTSPSCSSLTDDICKQLWNEKNQGNVSFQTGSVKIGETGKSGIAANYRMDLEALLDSESRLPTDLRNAAGPILLKFRDAMKRENGSKEWLKGLGKITDEWNSAFHAVAEKRAETQSPSLKSTKDEDLTVEQKGLYREKSLELSDEILRAKYQNSPRWKNVERVFEEAKSDLLAVIQGLDAPDALKKTMLEKVRSVKLSLPYVNPRVLGVENTCATTQRDALYSRKHNVLTVCAGSFNSYQVLSNLYATIAHEISHATDPVNVAQMKYDETPIAQVVGKLSVSGPAPFTCDQWKTLLDEELKLPSSLSEPKSPFQALTDCLAPTEDELLPFDAKTLASVSKTMAANAMNAFASTKSFISLAQATVLKRGKPAPNEFYLRPDKMEASINNNLPLASKNTLAAIPGVFVQSLSCAKVSVDGKDISFADASQEQRNEMFQRAIETTRHVQQVAYATKFSICGRECPELVSAGLSRNAQEQFADWLSIKALPRHLLRERSLAKRRELSGFAAVDLCSEPGPEQSAPDFAAIEKSYSFESHPDNRIRRLSVFTPEVAQAVNCRLDDEIRKGFSSCHF